MCYYIIYTHIDVMAQLARYTVWNLMMSVHLFLSRATAAVVCVAWKAVLRLLGWCVSWLLSSTQILVRISPDSLVIGGKYFWASLLQWWCHKVCSMMPHLLNGGARNGSWYIFVHGVFLNKLRKERHTCWFETWRLVIRFARDSLNIYTMGAWSLEDWR